MNSSAKNQYRHEEEPDPFYSVKKEVEEFIQGITLLYQRWKSHDISNDELIWVSEEIKKGLKLVREDVEDLDLTITSVESGKSKVKLDKTEISNRKAIVQYIKQTINTISNDIQQSEARIEKAKREALVTPPTKVQSAKSKIVQQEIDQKNQHFVDQQLQLQQKMVKEQDKLLDSLKQTTQTLYAMGMQMSSTIKEQEPIIEDLHRRVDKENSKLIAANKQVTKLQKLV